MHLKMAAKWLPFCPEGDELINVLALKLIIKISIQISQGSLGKTPV